MNEKFIIQPSAIFIVWIHSVYFGSLSCITLSGAPVVLKITASLLCIIFYLRCIFKRKLLTTAVWSISGTWYLENQGRVTSAILKGDSYISRFLLILNFVSKANTGRQTLILFPGVLDKASFKRLRAFLLIQNFSYNARHEKKYT